MLTTLLIASAICAQHTTTKVQTTGNPVVSQKINLLVESCQLKAKGKAYCQQITKYLIQAGAKTQMDPYILASTAYHESRFTMASKPQMGIMQFTRGTWRSNFGPQGKLLKGLDPWNAAHNILAGGAYLRGHLLSSRGSVRGMWLKYNQGHASTKAGVYRSTAYTRQCERTLERLRTWDVKHLAAYLATRNEL